MKIKITSGIDYFTIQVDNKEKQSKPKNYEVQKIGSEANFVVGIKNASTGEYIVENARLDQIEVNGEMSSSYEELSLILTPILFSKGGGSGTGGSGIEDIVAGANIFINKTNPLRPIISAKDSKVYKNGTNINIDSEDKINISVNESSNNPVDYIVVDADGKLKRSFVLKYKAGTNISLKLSEDGKEVTINNDFTLPSNIATIDEGTKIGNAYKKIVNPNDGKTYLLNIDGTKVDSSTFGKVDKVMNVAPDVNKNVDISSENFNWKGQHRFSNLADKKADLTFKNILGTDDSGNIAKVGHAAFMDNVRNWSAQQCLDFARLINNNAQQGSMSILEKIIMEMICY